MGNMYSDSIKQWNVFVGCKFDCSYCRKSFQAQMKRQKPKFDENGKQYRGCQQCYDYEPHFHEERITKKYMKKLPNTFGDQFIWVGSSGDISFIKVFNMMKILNKIEEYPQTFFFQTKNPEFFHKFKFPKNAILGITLETNRYYPEISNAPYTYDRFYWFKRKDHPRKIVTIEPIMEFDFDIFLEWLKEISPERVYIGYDTKKNYLPEPSLEKTKKLIKELEKFTKVKLKYMKEEK